MALTGKHRKMGKKKWQGRCADNCVYEATGDSSLQRICALTVPLCFLLSCSLYTRCPCDIMHMLAFKCSSLRGLVAVFGKAARDDDMLRSAGETAAKFARTLKGKADLLCVAEAPYRLEWNEQWPCLKEKFRQELNGMGVNISSV